MKFENLFFKALNTKCTEPTILVKFYNRNDLTGYINSGELLELLKSDPAVQDILDGETGEVIFTHDKIEARA